jgi:basic membrane lipoprotein Med (substrate-binding protein (PBP1-ABC) superfamily)
MKRVIWIVLMGLLLALFAACAPAEQPQPAEDSASDAASESGAEEEAASEEEAAPEASSDEPFKIAFVYVAPIGDLGWTWAHDQGRLAIEEEFGDKVETAFIENVPEGPESERVIRDFAQKGYDLILTTSFGYMDPTITDVNPEAEVRVVWTNTWFGPPEEKEAAEALLSAGADVIAQHQDTTEPQKAAADSGGFSIGYDADMSIFVGDTVLTSPVWNWGPKYVGITQEVMDGTYAGSESYWGGMDEGVVELAPLSARVSDDTKALIEERSEEIISGDFGVFCGPLVGSNGNLIVEEGKCLTDGEMLSMDYFIEGVQGEAPAEAPTGLGE